MAIKFCVYQLPSVICMPLIICVDIGKMNFSHYNRIDDSKIVKMMYFKKTKDV